MDVFRASLSSQDRRWIGGNLVPAVEVVAFHRAYDWNAETASHKLAPLVARTWFAEALLPRLSLNSMDEEQAVVILAEAANADPKYRARNVSISRCGWGCAATPA